MHLLVLSAFRRELPHDVDAVAVGLNAPFGAQCFPTGCDYMKSVSVPGLNAPFGAQCFPTR